MLYRTEELLTVQQWRKTKSFNGRRNENCNLESPRTKIKLTLLLNMQQPAVTYDHQGYTVNSLIATISRKRPPPVSDHFNLSCTNGGRLRESRLYFRNSSITFQHSNAKWKMYEPLLLTSRLAALRSSRQYNKHKKAARESLKVLKVEWIFKPCNIK